VSTFSILAQHRKVKEESKILKIEVQFDKMVGDESDSENDTNVAKTTTTTTAPPSVTKPTVRANSPVKQSEAPTGFLEFNPQRSTGTVYHQPPQPVPVVTANSWTTGPIMTTLPVAQWASEPSPSFSQTQATHWSHQQEHQPLVDPFSIGTWGQPSEPAPQHNWTGDWSNDGGKNLSTNCLYLSKAWWYHLLQVLQMSLRCLLAVANMPVTYVFCIVLPKQVRFAEFQPKCKGGL